MQRTRDQRLVALDCVVPLGATVGWEAAVFDHVQAVVQTICQRLRLLGSPSAAALHVGGSTYGFELSADHPLHDEVLGLLERLRNQAGELRRRVDEYNRAHPAPRPLRVVTYIGQNTTGSDASEISDASVMSDEEGQLEP